MAGGPTTGQPHPDPANCISPELAETTKIESEPPPMQKAVYGVERTHPMSRDHKKYKRSRSRKIYLGGWPDVKNLWNGDRLRDEPLMAATRSRPG